MQTVKEIVLCEHDGVFFDGIPRNVVLIVTFHNGSKIRVPYAADKPISALYEDLNAIAPSEGEKLTDLEIHQEMKEALVQAVPLIHDKVNSALAAAKGEASAKALYDISDRANKIEKEDIVELIMLDPERSKDATCLLVVGQELRVISIKQTGIVLPGTNKITNVVRHYEVVDDHADRPERTVVFPAEVKLLRKRAAPIAKLEHKYEEMLPCPSCQVLNALVLDGSEYKGTCSACRQDISISRIIKSCQTDKCGQEVSCFDVGGKYEGRCNKCKSAIEVPYA